MRRANGHRIQYIRSREAPRRQETRVRRGHPEAVPRPGLLFALEVGSGRPAGFPEPTRTVRPLQLVRKNVQILSRASLPARSLLILLQQLVRAYCMCLGGDVRLRGEDLAWREIDGDLVILDLRASTYLTSNASGAVLMKALTEDRTEAELTKCLMDAFSIPAEQARRDVQSFVEALATGGLLEQASTG